MRGVKGGEPVILLAFLVEDNGRVSISSVENAEKVDGAIDSSWKDKARGTCLSGGAWQSGCIWLKGESTKLIRESASCFGITRT